MKLWQFLILMVLSASAAALTTTLIFATNANQKLSGGIAERQATLSKANLAQQVGTSVLRDIGNAAIANDMLKDLLAKHGYTITQAPAPGTAPADSAPSPATP